MLLLYRICPWVSHKAGKIYIPLCFYFISIVDRCSFASFFIYIPLCFYFIANPDIELLSTYKFTFHYASTLSGCSCFDSRIGSFTFHYASTLSSGSPAGKSCRSSFTFHYASTLSSIIVIQKSDWRAFTFHYASTLSEVPVLRFLPVPLDLHSTMLLLYPRQQSAKTETGTIYIPLCFYFIAVLTPMKDVMPHLHSTMLLLYLSKTSLH